MPKINISINKTNTRNITKWLDTAVKGKVTDIGVFSELFNAAVTDELRNHRDCSEKSVVEAMMTAFGTALNNGITEWTDTAISDAVMAARHILAAKYTANKQFNNNIDIYFNEVKRQYILHPMSESDSLELVPENRETFIKNNLKLVVTCAKKYRNMGLPFEDLIQAGNYGLCIAFNKFDRKRAKLRTAMISNIDSSGKDSFSYNEAVDIIKRSFTYGKDLDRTLGLVPKDGFANNAAFKAWVTKNVKTAVFASVAFKWITAYILMELSKLGKTVKLPQRNQRNTKEEPGSLAAYCSSAPQQIVSLDTINPHTNDNYCDSQFADTANEEFIIEESAIDEQYNRKLFQDVIYKAIARLPDINRRLIKKRFGIGYPCALNIADIAESEGLTPNRVKYIISDCLKDMNKNISGNDRNALMEIFGSAAEV